MRQNTVQTEFDFKAYESGLQLQNQHVEIKIPADIQS